MGSMVLACAVVLDGNVTPVQSLSSAPAGAWAELVWVGLLVKSCSKSAMNCEETFPYGGDDSGMPMMKIDSVLASSVLTWVPARV